MLDVLIVFYLPRWPIIPRRSSISGLALLGVDDIGAVIALTLESLLTYMNLWYGGSSKRVEEEIIKMHDIITSSVNPQSKNAI